MAWLFRHSLSLFSSSAFYLAMSIAMHGGAFVLAAPGSPDERARPLWFVELLGSSAATQPGTSQAQVHHPTTRSSRQTSRRSKSAHVPEAVKNDRPVLAEPDDSLTSHAAIASAPEPSGFETGTAGGAGSSGWQSSAELRYLQSLRDLLRSRRIYPAQAKQRGHTGTVIIRFTLKADGGVVEADIVSATEDQSLNEAALSTIKSLDHLLPFSPGIARTTWTMTLPIEFRLERR